MQLSGIVPLTWFSMFTQAHRSSLHQEFAALLVVTSSFAASRMMETQLNWMKPFKSHAPSSSLLLLPQQKPNLVYFSWTCKKLKFYNSSLPNLAIHNHQPQYTLTTQQQLELSTTWFKSKDQEQWRWDTFGYWTSKHTNTSNSSTNPASKTSLIIHPNIILPIYINTSVHIMSTWKTPPLSCQELWNQALIKGELKSLGIPTPRNPHYQALAISPVWPTPLSFPVIQYLASQE